MSFKAIPIEMITAPNFYSANPNNRWDITDPNPTTLWLQFSIQDALGSRPYVPAANAVLTVTFQRSVLTHVDNFAQTTQTQRSIVKTAAPNATNKTLFSIPLTSQDIQAVTSGSVLFSLLENGCTTNWIQDWCLKKTLTAPGF